jgi:hypothetical protein
MQRFQRNGRATKGASGEPPRRELAPTGPATVVLPPAAVQRTSAVRRVEGNVEVTIKFPFGKGKVRVLVEADAAESDAEMRANPTEPVARAEALSPGGNGRKLLFVTNRNLLTRKIGAAAVEEERSG